MEEKKTSEAVEEVVAEPKEVGNLAMAELVFPFKSSPLVVAGIPKMYLPLHEPQDPISLSLSSPPMYP